MLKPMKPTPTNEMNKNKNPGSNITLRSKTREIKASIEIAAITMETKTSNREDCI